MKRLLYAVPIIMLLAAACAHATATIGSTPAEVAHLVQAAAPTGASIRAAAVAPALLAQKVPQLKTGSSALTAASAPAAQVPDPGDIGPFAQAVIAAIAAKNWGLLASLAVVAIVFVLRKVGVKVPALAFLGTDRGGAVLSLVVGVAGAVGTALLAGTPFTIPLLISAVGVAFTASGGFSLIKKLFWPSDADPAPAPAAPTPA